MSATTLFSESNVVAVLNRLESRAMLRSGSPKAGAAVPATEPLNYFHSRVLPGASLRTMAVSMANARIAVDWTTLALATVLFARYEATTPVTAHMSHRLLVGCVVVAAKAHQDSMPSNGLVGRIVGMTGRELTRLEFALAKALDWKFVVDASAGEFEDLCAAATIACAKSKEESDYLSLSPQSATSPQAAVSSIRESLIANGNSASSDLIERCTTTGEFRAVEHVAT